MEKAATSHKLDWVWVRGHQGHAENERKSALIVHSGSILDSEQSIVRPDCAATVTVKSNHCAAFVHVIEQRGCAAEIGIIRC